MSTFSMMRSVPAGSGWRRAVTIATACSRRPGTANAVAVACIATSPVGSIDARLFQVGSTGFTGFFEDLGRSGSKYPFRARTVAPGTLTRTLMRRYLPSILGFCVR